MSRPYRISTDKTWAETRAELRECFQRWAEHEDRHIDWSVDCAVPPAKTTIRSLAPEDRQVIVSFVHPRTGTEVRVDAGDQERPVDNLRKLYLIIEDMRMIERRGMGETMQNAYMQLPAPKTKRDPYEVLGCRSDAPHEVLEAAYRARAKQVHPDAGGDPEEFRELQEAWEAVS